ncbi:hypothetical protein ZOD2009_00700 [Haladaptatus paucihalophilus DX253]|uniref:Uncharacterized protein n=1 Tax=Haladaptatus paucihalophilus DX253 TaxID=797209 RepID=E7QNW4_HALPU|nr:hypothetical protein [Haladaptatus paucihalophilus]EFW93617.1 hypothetical protein ZOD2009_00700 [Haladaptatus paucihalophilus DX253]SHL45650.1 hypothetical protein SAMN05444342_3844 [Haladaptatus paucihalophilus DX253]
MSTDFADLSNRLGQSIEEFDDENSRTKLTTRIQRALARLEDAFESADSFEEVSERADTLWTLLDEAEDVFDGFDADPFLKTVDVGQLPNAIEFENVPDAVESGNLRDALDSTELVKAVNFREFWSSEEMQSLWEEGTELTDAIDSLSDSDSDDDEDGSGLGDMTGDTAEMASKATEGKLQSELEENAEQFREQIDAARDRLKDQIAQSELGSGGERGDDSAGGGPGDRPDMKVTFSYSTMPDDRPDIDATPHYSTMPKRDEE